MFTINLPVHIKNVKNLLAFPTHGGGVDPGVEMTADTFAVIEAEVVTFGAGTVVPLQQRVLAPT